MVVIVDHVTITSEEDSNALATVKETAGRIEKDIRELLTYAHVGCSHGQLLIHYSTLETIKQDLTAISAQGKLVVVIYRELNADKLEDCINRLSVALERFKVW